MYFFLGVVIVLDIFMVSIEIIISKKKKIMVYDVEKKEIVEREVLVWNEIVVNLILMVLGSSVFEIILVLGEIVFKLG